MAAKTRAAASRVWWGCNRIVRPFAAVVQRRRSAQAQQLVPKRAARLVVMVTVRAAHRRCLFVDVEVVEGEPALDGWSQRHRLDDRNHVVVVEVGPKLARPVGGVAEHFGAFGFAVEQVGCGFGVADVSRGEFHVGDDPGVGLGCEVGLEAVAVGVLGLVDVTRLGVDGRHDPVRRGALGNAPPALLRVMAGTERGGAGWSLARVNRIRRWQGCERQRQRRCSVQRLPVAACCAR